MDKSLYDLVENHAQTARKNATPPPPKIGCGAKRRGQFCAPPVSSFSPLFCRNFQPNRAKICPSTGVTEKQNCDTRAQRALRRITTVEELLLALCARDTIFIVENCKLQQVGPRGSPAGNICVQRNLMPYEYISTS